MADRYSPTIHDLGGWGGWPEYSDPGAFEAELERQADIFRQLGFHTHENVHKSAGKLKDVIMKAGAELQQIQHWRFDIPIVGFGQIPVSDQRELIGEVYDDTGSGVLISDWSKDPQKYKTPETTYLTWVMDGGLCVGRTVEFVREILLTRSHERRGATIHDGMGLLAVHPEIFVNFHSVDLPGSEVGPDKAALIYAFDDFSINARAIDAADQDSGSASCVRQMILIP